MESTVTTVVPLVACNTFVFLLIVNCVSGDAPIPNLGDGSGANEILKYFLDPRKTSSIAATAPLAVGSVVESCDNVVASNFFGSPSIASTIISSVFTQSAEEG